MVKKVMVKKETSPHVPYIAIVALVAVIAVVVLVLNMRSEETPDMAEVLDEEGNFAGQAFRLPGGAYKINAASLKKAAQQRQPAECPTGLKDYEIEAYADPGLSFQEREEGITAAANFRVNDLEFRSTLPIGFREILPTGEWIELLKSSVGRGKKELRGVEFKLEKACRKGYIVRVYHADTRDQTNIPVGDLNEWDFWMDGESFTLKPGEDHILRDGTKIILKHDLIQAYAGGLWGVSLEVICQG